MVMKSDSAWMSRNGSWIVGAIGLIATALLGYGVLDGRTTERLAAQDMRIERIEAQQLSTDKAIRDVKDALSQIGADTAVTRAKVEGVEKQMQRVETRIDAAVAGGRREP